MVNSVEQGPRSPAPKAKPPLILGLVLEEPNKRWALRLVRAGDCPLVIGRDRTAGLQICDLDQQISRAHCSIIADDVCGTYSVVDHSISGTFINGAAAPLGRGQCVVITNGMQIGLGKFRLTATVGTQAIELASGNVLTATAEWAARVYQPPLSNEAIALIPEAANFARLLEEGRQIVIDADSFALAISEDARSTMPAEILQKKKTSLKRAAELGALVAIDEHLARCIVACELWPDLGKDWRETFAVHVLHESFHVQQTAVLSPNEIRRLRRWEYIGYPLAPPPSGTEDWTRPSLEDDLFDHEAALPSPGAPRPSREEDTSNRQRDHYFGRPSSEWPQPSRPDPVGDVPSVPHPAESADPEPDPFGDFEDHHVGPRSKPAAPPSPSSMDPSEFDELLKKEFSPSSKDPSELDMLLRQLAKQEFRPRGWDPPVRVLVQAARKREQRRFISGRIFYRVPRRMWKEVPELAELRLSPKSVFSDEELRAIQSTFYPRAGQIEEQSVERLGMRMAAELCADAVMFRVDCLSTPEQDFDLEDLLPLRWDWRLTPVKPGQTTVRLRLTIRLDIVGNRFDFDTKAFERRVEISIRSRGTEVRRFWRDNWKWVLTTGGGLGTAATFYGWMVGVFGGGN